jgi:MYXO-CTERM domain-containing protein
MKKLIIALAALSVSVAAYGQGQFYVNNRIGTEVTARIVMPGDAAGTSSVGSPDWTVSFLGGAAGTPIASLKPLDPAGSTFRGAAGSSGAGYFNGQTVTVAGVDSGKDATVLLRVLGPGGAQTDFGPYPVTLGGGVNPPPNLQLGTANLVVPEPTTLALAALGLGALLAIRRRN